MSEFVFHGQGITSFSFGTDVKAARNRRPNTFYWRIESHGFRIGHSVAKARFFAMRDASLRRVKVQDLECATGCDGRVWFIGGSLLSRRLALHAPVLDPARGE